VHQLGGLTDSGREEHARSGEQDCCAGSKRGTLDEHSELLNVREIADRRGY
jgi:hypothetical protein